MGDANETDKTRADAKSDARGKDKAEKVAEFTPAPPLGEDRWQLREHRNPGHWVCVPAGTTIEQLLEPAFWANVARHLQRSTTVEVHWDDASQFAELYVLDAGRNWASVDVLRHKKELKRPQLRSEEQFEVHFNGPVDKFRIVRISDRSVIKAGFATEVSALQFLADYKRKLAA
jgi:hypothetical protein